jgi:hypothetical protein
MFIFPNPCNIKAVLRVRIGYNADSDPHLDPAFFVNVVPELDPDPGL